MKVRFLLTKLIEINWLVGLEISFCKPDTRIFLKPYVRFKLRIMASCSKQELREPVVDFNLPRLVLFLLPSVLFLAGTWKVQGLRLVLIDAGASIVGAEPGAAAVSGDLVRTFNGTGG